MINYGTRFIMALKKNSLDNNSGVITMKKFHYGYIFVILTQLSD